MSKDVPRGTSFPAELEAWENEVTGYQAPDPLQERRRVRAAGFAHIDRIAVDGGPVIEPKPIRRHFVRNVVGVIGVAICAIGVTVVVWGCVG